MIERVRNESLLTKIMTAEEASLMISTGMRLGFSGFTSVGYPKKFPMALAKRAENEDCFKVSVITGASVGDELDGSLTRANAVDRRYPYQSNKSMRDAINSGKVSYVDMHLSQVPYWIKHNYFGRIDFAVVEAAAIDERGNIIPTLSVGCADTLVQYADKVIVEINTCIPDTIEGIHDIYSSEKIPNTKPIPIERPNDRVGTTYIPCTPDRIAAIVICDIPDGNNELKAADENMQKIAEHLIRFLHEEVDAGRMPLPLPPIQSGVGGVANAVLSCLEKSDFDNLTIYTEVMQDAVIKLIKTGKVKSASGTALTVSPSKKSELYNELPSLSDTIVIRPEEISNSPEIIRRLGVIAINTALEVDLSGNVNSTHVNGNIIMNGIGGSGDFARNAGLTIFTTVSTVKDGKLSCVVPYVSHVDHTEHDVDVIITEQGIADLRGLTAYERAVKIIEQCAHPIYRAMLREYLAQVSEVGNYGHGIPMLK